MLVCGVLGEDTVVARTLEPVAGRHQGSSLDSYPPTYDFLSG